MLPSISNYAQTNLISLDAAPIAVNASQEHAHDVHASDISTVARDEILATLKILSNTLQGTLGNKQSGDQCELASATGDIKQALVNQKSVILALENAGIAEHEIPQIRHKITLDSGSVLEVPDSQLEQMSCQLSALHTSSKVALLPLAVSASSGQQILQAVEQHIARLANDNALKNPPAFPLSGEALSLSAPGPAMLPSPDAHGLQASNQSAIGTLLQRHTGQASRTGWLATDTNRMGEGLTRSIASLDVKNRRAQVLLVGVGDNAFSIKGILVQQGQVRSPQTREILEALPKAQAVDLGLIDIDSDALKNAAAEAAQVKESRGLDVNIQHGTVDVALAFAKPLDGAAKLDRIIATNVLIYVLNDPTKRKDGDESLVPQHRTLINNMLQSLNPGGELLIDKDTCNRMCTITAGDAGAEPDSLPPFASAIAYFGCDGLAANLNKITGLPIAVESLGQTLYKITRRA